jgi:hypothetical protein
VTEYGDLIVKRTDAVVIQADQVVLCSVQLLREMGRVHFEEPDVVFVGTDKHALEVRYRITGWDSEHRCLVMWRML